MMILCFLMMRGGRGTIMGGFGCCGRDRQRSVDTPSANDIIDWQYASGKIEREEYEEKKRAITGPAVADTDGSQTNAGTAR